MYRRFGTYLTQRITVQRIVKWQPVFLSKPAGIHGSLQAGAWFSCTCCITNMTRFLPSVPGYVYAQNKNDLYVNLFMSSTSNIKLSNGAVNLVLTTDSPWKGKIDIAVFTPRTHIPGWTQQKPLPGDLYSFLNGIASPVVLYINNKATAFTTDKGYAVLKREWKKGDHITLQQPMEPEMILANSNVNNDKSSFALERGPIVYCADI